MFAPRSRVHQLCLSGFCRRFWAAGGLCFLCIRGRGWRGRQRQAQRVSVFFVVPVLVCTVNQHNVLPPSLIDHPAGRVNWCNVLQCQGREKKPNEMPNLYAVAFPGRCVITHSCRRQVPLDIHQLHVSTLFVKRNKSLEA